MTATATLPAGSDIARLLEGTGIDPLSCSFVMSGDGLVLTAPGIAQEALDAAVAAYRPAASVVVRTIAPLDFLARFVDAEKAAIYTARRSIWQVDDFITQLAATPILTLDDGAGKPDPRIKAGVDFLVAAGLLSAERGAAVLAP